jgi:cytoskeletal protein CcmA (bactofilin family)
VSEPILENPDLAEPTCAIGRGASFDGVLTFWGFARVEGSLRGQVVADGRLEIGPDADVHARIEVDVLVVEGLVEGEVLARQRVEVRATGRITAALRTPRLVLDEGGQIEGRIEMGSRRSPSLAETASAA